METLILIHLFFIIRLPIFFILLFTLGITFIFVIARPELL
jgi:hypothetical protein